MHRHLWGFSERNGLEKEENIHGERQLSERKHLPCQRRTARLVPDDRKATVIHISTRYKRGVRKSVDLEADGLQQRRSPPGADPVSEGLEIEATICTGSPGIRQQKIGKHRLL